ncbi:peptidase inhibitor family I36 protein [Pilimelia columellifera]
MRTSLKAAAAAVVAGAAAMQVVTTGAAQAERKDCSDRYVCLWGDSNYAGRCRFQPEHNLFVSNIGSARTT